jgi:hypothetical protein
MLDYIEDTAWYPLLKGPCEEEKPIRPKKKFIILGRFPLA